MLEIELTELVENIRRQKCESNYIELKAAEKGCPRLFDTFSSFSNQQNGGKIIFGINENADYEVCGVYDAADLQKKIMEQSLQMEPAIRPLCTVANIDGKTVVCTEIQEIDVFLKPCFYKGAGRLKGSYVRVGDSDRIMSEYEVYSFEAFKKKTQDELRETERAEISDISTPAFDKYLAALKSQKHNFAAMADEKIRKLQGFGANDKPTLAGIILFAEYPQAYYPQLCITAVSVPGTEMSMTGNVGERFLDNQKIDGTLPQMLNDALFFVRKNMKKKTIIDKNTGKRTDKTEYPIEAVREIIVNALIHRDYSIYTDSAPITIRMFTDRIEVENPGGLYGRMTLDRLGKVSADTRNPFIANALEIMGETENRYSGIPTVINAMKEAELPPPKFENDRGIFKVTLYNKTVSDTVLDDTEQEIIDFCKTPKSRSEIEKLFEGRMTIAYIMTKYIHPLTEKGILALAIPDKPKSKKQKYFSQF
ncbi:MAG: putative DNA binding domain-containing protein [Ruminococcus sp.]|nr:putative DNA binding domain-containing protein [Ruminococcus sp.]